MKKQKIKLKCLKFATKIGVTYRGGKVISVDELAKDLYDWVTDKEQKSGTTKDSPVNLAAHGTGNPIRNLGY